MRVVALGRVSCREALHLARAYYGRLAANRCGRLNNFCDLALPGGWSCSIFFAPESRKAGGAGAGCFRASSGAKVRFYSAGTARGAAQLRDLARDVGMAELELARMEPEISAI